MDTQGETITTGMDMVNYRISVPWHFGVRAKEDLNTGSKIPPTALEKFGFSFLICHLFLCYSSFCYIHRTHVHFVPSRLPAFAFAFVYKNKTRFKKLINYIEHPSFDRCKRLTFS